MGKRDEERRRQEVAAMAEAITRYKVLRAMQGTQRFAQERV